VAPCTTGEKGGGVKRRFWREGEVTTEGIGVVRKLIKGRRDGKLRKEKDGGQVKVEIGFPAWNKRRTRRRGGGG